jgi:hypothetical protein
LGSFRQAVEKGISRYGNWQGVSGTPDLAATILQKIEQAFLFIGDVTLVGEYKVHSGINRKSLKKTINSNVAIEYGFALSALTDARILLVQNTYYGDRDQLPFDLIHKAGPIQFHLSEDSDQNALSAEAKKLRRILGDAIGLCLRNGSPIGQKTLFQGQSHTARRAYFWEGREALASFGTPIAEQFGHHQEEIAYHFDHPHVFYLRLIPADRRELQAVVLQDVVKRRQVAVLTRQLIAGMPSRNRFGAIIFQNSGDAENLIAATQLFESGEIWGVTAQMAGKAGGTLHVYTRNVQTIMKAAVSSYLEVATNDLNISYPFQCEVGAVGLKGLRLGLPRGNPYESSLSDEIFKDELYQDSVIMTDRPSPEGRST